MDAKKSYKADLESRRASGFLLGLVVALSLFLVSLEFTTHGGQHEAGDDFIDDLSQDIEMAPAIHHDDMVAAAAGRKKDVASDKINIVDKAADEAPADNAPDVKAFADALDAHAKQIKKNDELQAQFEQNVDASETTIENWAQQHKATPEQIDAISEFINQQFGNLIAGIISPEMLDFAFKGLNYDKDVAAAEENGQAAGRNQRIEEKMRKGKGDGMPMIAGGGRAQQRPKDNFLASAAQEDPWNKAKREKY